MNYLVLLLSTLYSWTSLVASSCVCTTVSCPIVGENTLIEGVSGKGVYKYYNHDEQPVVLHAYATITNEDLDNGSGTTSCTQDYSRMLDDENLECDAGHILANRLGGPGNQPINIFPQKPSVNRGIFASFEETIYDCINTGKVTANLYWEFSYNNSSNTRPYQVYYNASFSGGNCDSIEETFDNVGQ